jgi:hypothetical protein
MRHNLPDDFFPALSDHRKVSSLGDSPWDNLCSINEHGDATFQPLAWALLVISGALLASVLGGALTREMIVPAMGAVAFCGYLILRGALTYRP